MNETFYLGELFCGPGGMALGAKLADVQISSSNDLYSIKHVWGVDKDPNAIKTYNANNLGIGIECDALKFTNTFCEGDSPHISNYRMINALAFGFPCNDFSMVGERKGVNGKFGNLYQAGLAAITYANPKWFIAENVSGIHSANAGTAFKDILQKLSSAGRYGYKIKVHLFKFEDYGVPQYRHRFIIIGIRNDLGLEFKVPAPTHEKNHVSVKEALSKSYKEDVVYNNTYTRQHQRVKDRLLFIPPWKNAWYLDDLVLMTDDARRTALKSLPWYATKINHLSDQEILTKISDSKLNCKKAKMSHIYKRLNSDRPSYTITGSGGGGTHVYHWEDCRALTNRERARIQSFPDDFIFFGKKEQIRKQIGMAVPSIGAKVIFEAILKLFAGIPYDFVDSNYI